jgi:Terpene cyclase DEP1
MNNPGTIRSRAGWFYLLLALVGLVLPLRHFLRFLVTEGLNLSLFFGQLFQNDISSFFAMDLFVSAIALWVFVFVEGRRRRMKGLWIYVVCTMIVGVSLALPLFLFFRERART